MFGWVLIYEGISMTSVSSLNGSNTSAINNYATSTAKTETAASSQTQTESDASVDTVELSTRAQKIQKLNEEFFPTGPKNFTLSQTFIERLNEYGLISDSEASSLGSSLSTSSDDGDTTALDELTEDVTSLIERLKDQDSDNALIEPLQQALDVIDSFDSYQASDSSESINTILTNLNYYQSSAESGDLNDSDAKTINQLKLALKVADKLSPSTLSSEKVSGYLAVFDQIS
ncbi:hypothetical Protein YC6258_04800 [Gynuella sunshinyii YC6258]|uniref:Uncharacterized protein n=2 Tax=Gynuella sunshinyii TaxID=1445505 RepID=A0A0C5VQH9_9GAMM|nr:hypothetical Protein YC6258_04800 [Gynuella sunshinyii YC6258]